MFYIRDFFNAHLSIPPPPTTCTTRVGAPLRTRSTHPWSSRPWTRIIWSPMTEPTSTHCNRPMCTQPPTTQARWTNTASDPKPHLDNGAFPTADTTVLGSWAPCLHKAQSRWKWDHGASLLFSLGTRPRTCCLAHGGPSDFREHWLAVTMGARASCRLAHGCGSGSVQVSHGFLATHHCADPSPAMSGLRTSWHVRNWRVEMAKGQSLRFGLEMTSCGHHELSVALPGQP